MHYNIIKRFIEEFKRCPKCGNHLKINAKQLDNDPGKIRKFFISSKNDELIINITSDYFVIPGSDSFEFSISILNGNILYSDQANHFISLYDLNIILFKDCRHCMRMLPPESFFQSINIFYDRLESSFTFRPWIESFSFSHDNNFYYFANDFKEKRSLLSIQILEPPFLNPIIQTPFIPFDKFNFRNKEKLCSKMNSIRLLK